MQQHGPTTYTCPEFSSVCAAATCNPIPYLQPQFLGHRHTVVGKGSEEVVATVGIGIKRKVVTGWNLRLQL
ncbi:hypothetical protein Goklo_000352, partial [Gossypium klotzschianum]|nr:hypothetical protein [Gossypium klotzschianum]